MDTEVIDGVSIVRLGQIDPQVRAGWLSDETFARIGTFIDALE